MSGRTGLKWYEDPQSDEIAAVAPRKEFTAVHYALVSGSTIGSTEPLVLASYSTMFIQMLVSGWSLVEAVAKCEERGSYMRSKGIPHDAYCMIVHQVQDSLEVYSRSPWGLFKTGRVFLSVQPSKIHKEDTAKRIKEIAGQGLVFSINDVWHI